MPQRCAPPVAAADRADPFFLQAVAEELLLPLLSAAAEEEEELLLPLLAVAAEEEFL